MNIEVHTRTHCRVCGSERLREFLNLPNTPLVADYLRKEKLGTEFIWPLRIFLCLECGLTQTAHDIDERNYYDDYQYAPSLSVYAALHEAVGRRAVAEV